MVRHYPVWSSTPPRIVRKMLELAEIKSNDLFYDLGCGDGRFLVEASRRYEIRSIGIEINEKWVRKSREAIRKKGLEHLASVVHGDFFDYNLSDADIIVAYLNNPCLNELRGKLASELKDDSRILLYSYSFKGIRPKTQHAIWGWQLWFPPMIIPFLWYVSTYDGRLLKRFK